MPLRLHWGCCSLQGRRSENEDHVAVAEWPDAVVCVVADGMGGPDAGRLAGEHAAAALLANLNKPARDRAGPQGCEAALRTAFARAHDAVRAIQLPPRRRAGTTATLLLWLRGADRVRVAHVGDTLAYHLSAQGLKALTDGRASTWRGVIYRFLGCPELTEATLVDLASAPVQAGDRFLLCSDGLYPYATEAELAASLREPAAPRRIAEALCQRALERGSKDNVSAVVIDFDD
jgi:serine/threonine protein phosphatase PrpC